MNFKINQREKQKNVNETVSDEMQFKSDSQTGNEYFCSDCHLSFKLLLTFKEHNLSIMHHMKIDRKMIENGCRQPSHFCFICLKSMSLDNWIHHVKGKKHLEKLEQFRKKLRSESRNSDSSGGGSCNSKPVSNSSSRSSSCSSARSAPPTAPPPAMSSSSSISSWSNTPRRALLSHSDYETTGRTDSLLERTRNLMETFRVQRERLSRQQMASKERNFHKVDERIRRMHAGAAVQEERQASAAVSRSSASGGLLGPGLVRRNLEAAARGRAADLKLLVSAAPRGRRERQKLEDMLQAAAARQTRPVLRSNSLTESRDNDRIEIEAEELTSHRSSESSIPESESNFLQRLEADVRAILLRESRLSQTQGDDDTVSVTPLTGTARTVEEDSWDQLSARSTTSSLITDERRGMRGPSEKDLQPVLDLDQTDILSDSGEISSTARTTESESPASKKARKLSPTVDFRMEAVHRACDIAQSTAAQTAAATASRPIKIARRRAAESVGSSSNSTTSTVVNEEDAASFRAPLPPTSNTNPFHVSQCDQGMSLPLTLPFAEELGAKLREIKRENQQRPQVVEDEPSQNDVELEVVDSDRAPSRDGSVVSDVSSAAADMDVTLMQKALNLSLEEEKVRLKIEEVDVRLRALQSVIDETLKKMEAEESVKMTLRMEERDLREQRMYILRESYARSVTSEELQLRLVEEDTTEPDSSAMEELPQDSESTLRSVDSGVHALGDSTIRSIVRRVINTDLVDERSWDELEDVVRDVQAQEQQQRPPGALAAVPGPAADDVVSDQLSARNPPTVVKQPRKYRSLQNLSAACEASSSTEAAARSGRTSSQGNKSGSTSSLLRVNSEGQLSRPSRPRRPKRHDAQTTAMLKEYLHASSSSDIDLDDSDRPSVAKRSSSNSTAVPVGLQQQVDAFPGHLAAHCSAPVLDLLIHRDSFYTCSTDGTVKRFHLRTHAPVQMYAGHTALVHCLLISDKPTHTGQERIFSGGFDCQLLGHDLESGQLKVTLTMDSKVHCLTESWGLLFIGLGDSQVVTFDLDRSAVCNRWRVAESSSNSPVACLAAANDSSQRLLLVALSYGQEVTVREVNSGQMIRSLIFSCIPFVLLSGPPNNVYSLAGSSVFVHNYKTGKLSWEFEVGSEASCMTLLDNRRLLVGNLDGTVRSFECKKAQKKPLQVYYTASRAAIIAMAASSGSLLVTGDRTGEVNILKLKAANEILKCEFAGCTLGLSSRDELMYHVTRDHVLSCSESEHTSDDSNFGPPCRWKDCEHRFHRFCDADVVQAHLAFHF